MTEDSDELFLEAMARFRAVIERAKMTSLQEPMAVTLATADQHGLPAARVVLLRQLDERGAVFYTNSRSAKASQLAQNPKAALCFHWDELREQIRVVGDTEIVADDQADEYWARRPRDSQIGAWASKQSAVLDSRETFEKQIEEYEKRFEGRDVPRPDFWTGYRVVPHQIEFWVGQPARLHERVVYQRQHGQWDKRLLYP